MTSAFLSNIDPRHWIWDVEHIVFSYEQFVKQHPVADPCWWCFMTFGQTSEPAVSKQDNNHYLSVLIPLSHTRQWGSVSLRWQRYSAKLPPLGGHFEPVSLCFVSICLFLRVPCEPSRTTVSSTALDRVRAVHHRRDSEGTHNSSSPHLSTSCFAIVQKARNGAATQTVGLFISTPSITQCRWKHLFICVLAFYITFCLKVFHFTVVKENKEGEWLDCWNKTKGCLLDEKKCGVMADYATLLMCPFFFGTSRAADWNVSSST